MTSIRHFTTIGAVGVLAALTATGVTLAPAAVAGDSTPVGHKGSTVAGRDVWYGRAQALGHGWIRPFVASTGATPRAIGVQFPARSFKGLPSTEPTDGMHCFDLNGDGVYTQASTPDEMGECVGGYEQRLAIKPSKASTPYKFVMFNWNPWGHTPPVYNVPHMDFHFFFTPEADADAIRMGPCAELIHCDDFVTAIRPLPSRYQPVGYSEVEGAEGMMGDHMVDLTSGEFTEAGFTRTVIYGKYDAKLTFIEPMITVKYFKSLARRTQKVCESIKQPAKWQKKGWYPSVYCVGYDKKTDMYAVSLENFKRG